MTVPFAPQPGISGILGRMESAPYLPSESIFKSMHEKTVQMETDFSAAKTRNSNSDFLGPRNYKATAMHHGKWEWVFKWSCLGQVKLTSFSKLG